MNLEFNVEIGPLKEILNLEDSRFKMFHGLFGAGDARVTKISCANAPIFDLKMRLRLRARRRSAVVNPKAADSTIFCALSSVGDVRVARLLAQSRPSAIFNLQSPILLGRAGGAGGVLEA